MPPDQPGVVAVSMSYGSPEYPGDNTVYEIPSDHPGVTFLAATGDSGAPGSGYPAYSPNVVAVGGTSLSQIGGIYLGESGWSGSGGGISLYQPKPGYQANVTISATQRTIPDVAFLADPDTGVALLNSYDNGVNTPWFDGTEGGTSLACPCWAGLVAIADQGRALGGLGTIPLVR